jgi:hypothetical protein
MGRSELRVQPVAIVLADVDASAEMGERPSGNFLGDASVAFLRPLHGSVRPEIIFELPGEPKWRCDFPIDFSVLSASLVIMNQALHCGRNEGRSREVCAL